MGTQIKRGGKRLSGGGVAGPSRRRAQPMQRPWERPGGDLQRAGRPPSWGGAQRRVHLEAEKVSP